MKNLLLQNVEYKIETTNFGVWRRFVYPNGAYFAEFKSHATFWGLPLFHYTRGKCPETGRRIIAKGVIAVGRLATGIVAIGHASFGLITIGQLAYGKYVLAQLGYGEYVWSQNRADPEAVIFLNHFYPGSSNYAWPH